MAYATLLVAAGISGCVQFGWDRLSTEVPKAVIETLRSEALTQEHAALALAVPADRSAFSEDERITLQYLGRRMAQLGLVPAGDDGFLQEVHLNAIRIESCELRVGSRRFTQGEDLALWSRAGEGEIEVTAPVVFVGHGVVAPERQRDDYLGLDLRDKLALVLAGPSDSSYVDTWYADWRYQCAEAARQGASGVLLVHAGREGVPEAGVPVPRMTWPETVANFSRFQLALRGDSLAVARIEAWIPYAAGDELLVAAGIDPTMARSAARTAGFRGRELPLEFEARCEASVRGTRSFNLVGQIPGRYSEEQSVFFGASWDGGEENLLACAALLQLARGFGSLAEEPARSVVFAFFTLSIRDQLGAQSYALRPARRLDQCAGGVVFDGGLEAASDTVLAGGIGDNELAELVAEAAREDGFEAREESDRSRWLRSPGLPLAREGLPTASLGSEVEDIRVALRVGFRMAQTRGNPRWEQGSSFRFFPRTKK